MYYLGMLYIINAAKPLSYKILYLPVIIDVSEVYWCWAPGMEPSAYNCFLSFMDCIYLMI